MPDRNLLLKAMLSGAEVIFEPDGAVDAPFTREVESLLGGVPVVLYPDGTEQFLDDAEEPVNIYSPRLTANELEEFCKKNIAKYEAFNAEHGDEKLMSQRVAMPVFW